MANVIVRYDNLKTEQQDTLKSKLNVKFSAEDEIVKKSANKRVMVDVVEQIANEKNELAVALRDKGQVEQARQMLVDNSAYLKDNAVKYESKKLDRYSYINQVDSENLDEANWSMQRKSMRSNQSYSRTQNNNDRK